MSYPEWRDMLHDLRCIVPTTKHTPRMFMGQEVPALASHYILHPDGVLCGVDPTPWGHPWLGFIQYTLDGRAYVCVNGTIFSSEWAPIYMTRFSDYTDRIKPLPNQESNNQQVKPEQLAYEALQQKIAEHEQTMKELKEQAEKLKPKG